MSGSKAIICSCGADVICIIVATAAIAAIIADGSLAQDGSHCLWTEGGTLGLTVIRS